MAREVTFRSFSTTFDKTTFEIRTECHICQAFDPSTTSPEDRPLIVTCSAVWDTSANKTCISIAKAKELGLIPCGTEKMGHAAGVCYVDKYMINIMLPNHVGIQSLVALGCNLGNTDVLIGMDIINQGDFAISNAGGHTTFSFRIPSLEKIDFVAHDKAIDKAQKDAEFNYKFGRVKRNELCPCGSGKKFKYCHGQHK